MIKMMVSGGAGFIGSNFVRFMLSRYSDIEIVNLDLLTYSGRLENLQDIEKNPHYKFIRGDIQYRETVEKILEKGIDTIVNFAAETHVDRSIANADSFILTDTYGTYVLLDTARKYDVRRFMQVSTDEVYGSIEKGSSTETDLINPSNPYSASKAAGDLITQAFHRTYGLDVVITRSSNNFGPYQYPEKFLPKAIIRAVRGETVPLYGNGKQARDWIYVTDNCDALDIVMQKGKSGDIYNIASGSDYTNIEAANLVLRMLNRPANLIKFVTDRPGHDLRYSLDTTKTKELGWKPSHSFEDALRKTISWYTNNEWWWSPLLQDRYFQYDTPWLDCDPKRK